MEFNLLAWVSLAIVVSNLLLLANSRLTNLIRLVAFQGYLLGLLPLLMPDFPAEWHVVMLVVLSIAAKGILIPRFLSRAIRGVREIREINPVVGYSMSMAFGIVTSSLAFYLLRIAPFSHAIISPFHGATAIATAAIGFFLIITSRNIVRQIIGYLLLENAGFILGVAVASLQPLLVEMGVLLDILVGVFIMVMAVNHIYSEHNSLDIETLEQLTQ